MTRCRPERALKSMMRMRKLDLPALHPAYYGLESIARKDLMKASVHDISTGTFVPMLRSLARILDKAAQQAGAKKIDLAALPNARLAPDMYPLSRQVQIACDHAKGATARLTGQEPPLFEDNEQTIDDLKGRIAKTIEYVESIGAAAFEGAENRAILFPLIENLVFESNGFEYLRDWALPHFYFHVVTAYDIVRHNGIDIGKLDYLSHTAAHIHQRA